MKKSNQIKEIKKELANQSLVYFDKNGYEKNYDYQLGAYEDVVYVKLYYKGEVIYSNVEKLYTEAINWFLKLGYRFQGIREYRDNHEICLAFIKI